MQKVSLEEELGGARSELEVSGMAGSIRDARQVLVTTHVHPDGDAVGSEMAVALALRRLGKRVRVVNDHPAPDKYRFLDPAGTIEVLDGEPESGSCPDLDLGILVDTSEPSRTGRLEKLFFRPGLRRICLDHHPGPSSPLFVHHWVASSSPSTANLVLRLLDALGVEVDLPIATALFVSIATDTGWFRFANTTPLALRDASRLLAAGMDLESLHRRIYEEFSPDRIALRGRLLAGVRVELGGRFAWSLLDRETLERSGVPHEEMDGMAEEMKAIAGTEIVALILETEPGLFKVSLRSRGSLAVNAIAADFSGGGHAKAAGFKVAGEREAVLGRILARVQRELSSRGPPAMP